MPFAAIAPIAQIAAPTPITMPAANTAPAASKGNGLAFDNIFTSLIGNAEAAQQAANNEALAAATGRATDPTALVTAVAEAQLAFEVTTAVRNRAVEAFNEIMRMQV